MKKLQTILTAAIMLMIAGLAQAETFTIQVSPETGTCLRGGTSTVTSGWFSAWKSTGTPQITIQPANGGTTNNMTVATNGLTLAEGNGNTYTYSVSAPNGYVIQSMTASIASAEGTPTINFAGKSINTTTTAQTVTQSGIQTQSASIVLSSAGNNAKATLTAWSIIVEKGEASTEPRITYSTEEEVHWYYIYSAATNDYCKGQVWYYDSEANLMKWGTKAFMSDRIWSFWKNASGKIAIKNYDGNYVGKAGATNGGSSQFGKASSATAAYIYTISNYADGQFTISDGGTPLHAQASGNVLVRWPAEDNGASLWNFEEVDASNPQAQLGMTTVVQGKVTTGIGNKNCPILRSTLAVSGLSGSIDLQAIQGKIVAKNLADVVAVRAYFATNDRELYIDDAEASMPWRTSNGVLYAEGTIHEDGTYSIQGNKMLTSGTYYLWIAMDISNEAREGNTVDATITSYVVDGNTVNESNGNPEYAATIFLSEGTVLMAGDGKFKSTKFRIPAITATADGKRLITLTDDRLHHEGDLPSHVYITAQYSDDNGRSWSTPQIVAGEAATGGDYGHGDAQLITNRVNGDIIGIMTCATNGNGFFGSTPEKPQTWKTIISHDGGETWSKPVDHTKSLYAAGSPNPHWKGGFSGSGAGLQKRDGTLVSPFVNRETDNSQNFYFFMSKDGGQSWYVSGTSGTKSCDEPKVLERNNGDLAICVRAGGYNYHNVTSDDGETWKLPSQTRFTSGIAGNACDGEYMVWCSTLDGNPWNIALQTAPNDGSRRNVSIALSEDEGDTFLTPKTICPRGSAYSAATVLADGSLGVYYEENGVNSGYTMRFVRFSLDWASDGKYAFTQERPFYPIQTNITYEMPTYEWNTIVLPFEAELPTGMEAYHCTEQTITFTENDTEYTGIILEKAEGSTIAAYTPYVVNGNAGTYTFARPKAEWQAHPLIQDCISKSGPLVGQFVNKRVMGDGETIYNNFKNIASRGGVGFNRVTQGSQVTIPAYSCHLQLSQPDALTLRPLDASATAIENVVSEPTETTKMLYDLQGRPRQNGQRGIFILDGRKVLIP